jgi:predicted metal-dependent HD superfamily phosphohydrolase
MTHLKDVFLKLAGKYCSDSVKVSELWQEIFNSYTASDRYYHDLFHLNSMLNELILIKDRIDNWDVTLFALFYHDFIYDVNSSGNEEESMNVAVKELSELGVPFEIIAKVSRTILATKLHLASDENDINLFTDADICIFGKDNDTYKKYSQNIRLEYLIYPGYLYNEGRVRILQHFLDAKSIYKTNIFIEKYEVVARANIESEIKNLKHLNNFFVENGTNAFYKYLEEDGDLSEFFYNASKLLDTLENLETINYYPGWFDSGYYIFKFYGTILHLDYDGMFGTYLKTEPNPSEIDIRNANEVFVKLLEVRLTKDDLERLRKFYR